MSAAIDWQVRASDLFDRRSPESVDATGVGLIEGLVELWRRALSEGVRDRGGRTFTDFRLTWTGGSTDVGAQPFDNHELAALRAWVYGTPGPYEPGGAGDRAALLGRENASLLRAIAEAHARLMGSDRGYSYGYRPDSPAAKIRACAASSADAHDLEAKLATLTDDVVPSRDPR
jgi:hypothetical protein